MPTAVTDMGIATDVLDLSTVSVHEPCQVTLKCHTHVQQVAGGYRYT